MNIAPAGIQPGAAPGEIWRKRGFIGLGSQPRAHLRLFCFPFAGGGASAYHAWCRYFGSEIEVVTVELPGRGGRIDEQPLLRLTPLVEELASVLPLDRRFALFGHSMGALVSFELAHALSARKVRPEILFASSYRAPHLPSRFAPRHAMPDARLIEEIREMGGTPAEVIANPELRSMLLRQLRSDLEAAETHVVAERPPLDSPIRVFGGLADAAITVAELEGWRRHTSRDYRLRMFEGNHFYLYAAEPLLTRAISADIIAA